MGRSPTPSSSGTDHAEHLLRLQINQDSNSQAWTKFLITVQSALGAAFGILLLSARFTGIKLTLAVAVALAGIGTSAVMGKIIERQHKWSAFYLRRYSELPGNKGLVFPVGPPAPKTIDEVEAGTIADLIKRFCIGMIIFWAVASLVAVIWWGKS